MSSFKCSLALRFRQNPTDLAFHFPAPYVIQLTPRPNHRQNPSSPQSPSFQSDAASTASLDSPIPDQFTTSQEARSSLDSLTERMLRFNEALSSYYAGPNNILPSSITHHGLGYRTQLQQWDSAFDPLLQNRNGSGVSNTEHAGIAVLKMIHIMTSVLFLMAFSVGARFRRVLASIPATCRLSRGSRGQGRGDTRRSSMR